MSEYDLAAHAAFVEAILDNPSDLTTRLVFADWLDEHDPSDLTTRLVFADWLDEHDGPKLATALRDPNLFDYFEKSARIRRTPATALMLLKHHKK